MEQVFDPSDTAEPVGNMESTTPLPNKPTSSGHAEEMKNERSTDDAAIVANGPPTLDGEVDEDGDEDGDDTLSTLDLSQNLPGKKKKKKRKPKSKRGLNAPTGFEEYYVDTPLTPAEHEVEQQIYNKDLPFIDRILTAIQRFEQNRRLIPIRRDIFYKYLAYGSIDVGPNMFQSVDFKSTSTTADLDKSQLAAAMAQTSISSDKHDLNSPESLYVVDFPTCLAGFLSRRATDWFGTETLEQLELITTTIERFHSYLLQHDVCPEYNTQILEARSLARTAAKELWGVSEAQRWLPGDFNIACSTLFGGQYARDYDGQTNWGSGNDAIKTVFVGLTQDVANQIMAFGVAGAADEDVYRDFLQRVTDDSFEVLEVREGAGFEIVRVEAPTDDCKKIYKENASEFRPVGHVTAIPWTNPDAPPEDLTPEEREALSDKTQQKAKETYTFLLEEVVQRHLFVGMKVEATLQKLNCGNNGLWFFDQLLRCYCSFDVYLCNEMMMGWKKPKTAKGAVLAQKFVGCGSDDDDDDNDPDEAEDVGEVRDDATPGTRT